MIRKLTNHKYAFIWPLLGSLIIWVMICAVSGKVTANTLFVAARLATFSLLLALGQMVVVTSGDGAIDLSQIYILTLCAYLSCSLMGINIVLGLVVAVLAGAVCGLANGLINVYLRVPAMITTLATRYIIFTIILVSAPFLKSLPHPSVVRFVNTNFGNLSMLTIVCAVVAGLLAVLLYKTKFGIQLHAVGQSRTAAALANVPVNRVIISAFALGGALCGLAGVLCGAFIGGAFQDMGSTYFLPSVAATFVGGTVASGGRSNVLGVCFGALMMSLMTTFLNTAQYSPGLQRLIMGGFLVLILMASVSGKKK